ncbi:ArsR family transcriptional regulator [Halobacteria archaeon AArc-m2/3/4]|uniref:ArsR family transcriptional regulator n=1 Tax=Natronoglomus mannanivorans TaxID=2979990 RepID=A0AAP3E2T9_9EURY|nr:ArsR family transcriptional regulator [Halobacteria archaeon AArc-xg1-1]MCU4974239.1 ArsR family transcriptional regulator [Halobacteria archaeon AArc-m2/3/4]
MSEPSDAFQALGNEIRIGILETMLEYVDTDANTGSDVEDGQTSDIDSGTDVDVSPDLHTRTRLTFSELFETTGLETSAQFAYHLEQLVGPYLRKTESGYELTYSGLQIARAIASGAYTHRVDRSSISLAESCPFCEVDALEARSRDNVVTVACRACDRSLLSLQFPPAGLVAHAGSETERESRSESTETITEADASTSTATATETETETEAATETPPAPEAGIPDAFDRYHRHRLALLREGVCPECSGDVDATLTSVSAAVEDALPEALTDHVQASFECQQCGHDLRTPVALTLLQHPAIVSFYYDHGQDVRERPIWNVGHEWSESVLSTDPLCVRVVVELEGDVLALYVDSSLRVVEVQRAASETSSESGGDETRTATEMAAQTASQPNTDRTGTATNTDERTPHTDDGPPEANAETSSVTDTAETAETTTTESSTSDSSEGTTSA